MWIKPNLEKPCRVMVAKAAEASKYREKCKKQKQTKPVLTVDPKGSLPHPHVPLYRLENF
jgi:hypothetical protein